MIPNESHYCHLIVIEVPNELPPTGVSQLPPIITEPYKCSSMSLSPSPMISYPSELQQLNPPRNHLPLNIIASSFFLERRSSKTLHCVGAKVPTRSTSTPHSGAWWRLLALEGAIVIRVESSHPFIITLGWGVLSTKWHASNVFFRSCFLSSSTLRAIHSSHAIVFSLTLRSAYGTEVAFPVSQSELSRLICLCHPIFNHSPSPLLRFWTQVPPS